MMINLDKIKQMLTEARNDVQTSNALNIVTVDILSYLKAAMVNATDATKAQAKRGDSVASASSQFGRNAQGGQTGDGYNAKVGVGNYGFNKESAYAVTNPMFTEHGAKIASIGNMKVKYLLPKIPLEFKGDNEAATEYLLTCPNVRSMFNSTFKFTKAASTEVKPYKRSDAVMGQSANTGRSDRDFELKKHNFAYDSALDSYIEQDKMLINENNEVFILAKNILNNEKDEDVFLSDAIEAMSASASAILDKIFTMNLDEVTNDSVKSMIEEFRSNYKQGVNNFASESQLADYQPMFQWITDPNASKNDKLVEDLGLQDAKHISVSTGEGSALEPLNDSNALAVVTSTGSYSIVVGALIAPENKHAHSFGIKGPTAFGYIDSYQSTAGVQVDNAKIPVYFEVKSSAVVKQINDALNGEDKRYIKRVVVDDVLAEKARVESDSLQVKGVLKNVDGITFVEVPKSIVNAAISGKFTSKDTAVKPTSKTTQAKKSEAPVTQEPVKSTEIVDKGASTPTEVKPVEATPEPIKAEAPKAEIPATKPKQNAELGKPAQVQDVPKPSAAGASPRNDVTKKAIAEYKAIDSYATNGYGIPASRNNALNELLSAKDIDASVKKTIESKIARLKSGGASISGTSDVSLSSLPNTKMGNAALEKNSLIDEYLASGKRPSDSEIQSLVAKGIDEGKLKALIAKHDALAKPKPTTPAGTPKNTTPSVTSKTPVAESKGPLKVSAMLEAAMKYKIWN